MRKCLRIFGAYSYRLSRRHSTVLLIASFILILTAILHLYAYRHHDHLNTQQKIGDFDYKPGLFLKGQQPNGNVTFCNFQYGLPLKLDWTKLTVHPSPELGNIGQFKVIYDAIKGTAFTNLTKEKAVTYATQATPEFIYHILEIARYWDGPISLAVYVPNYDLDITMQLMTHLCGCYEGMSKVSLHLFYPTKIPPTLRTKDKVRRDRVKTTTKHPVEARTRLSQEDFVRQKLENFRSLNNITRADYIKRVRENKAKRMMMKLQDNKTDAVPDIKFEDCSEFDSFDIKTYRKRHNMMYPINVGRNAARNASRTNYFLVSDIELVPSEGLAGKFLTMVRSIMGAKMRDEGCVFSKTIFVVPLFEVERGSEIPRDKPTLIRLLKTNRAYYFHQKSCGHCQRFPGMQTWLNRPAPQGLEPMVICKREHPYHRWEPLYFGTHKDPWYSELLSWEGKQDKMIQMLEMCLQDYRLVVVDGGFMCHAAAPHTVVPNLEYATQLNLRRYAAIITILKMKYPKKHRCRVDT